MIIYRDKNGFFINLYKFRPQDWVKRTRYDFIKQIHNLLIFSMQKNGSVLAYSWIIPKNVVPF